MAMKRKGMANLPTRSPEFLHVREEALALAALLERDDVHPVDFGKRYAALSVAIADATEAAGLSSARFVAAAKALNLRTPKSELERFLGEDR